MELKAQCVFIPHRRPLPNAPCIVYLGPGSANRPPGCLSP